MQIPILSKINSLFRIPEFSLVVSLVVAVPLSLLCVKMFEKHVYEEKRIVAQNSLHQLSMQIRAETVDSDIIGATSLMGLLHEDIKAMIRGKIAPGSESVQSLVQVVAVELGTNNAFVVNGSGVILAYHAPGGAAGVGKNIAFRPYFKQALKGIANAYAAVGTNTNERGLYCASPVYAEKTFKSDVVGAVVIKIDFQRVDKLLARWDGPAVLLSPEGVVFSSTEKDLLFATQGSFTQAQMKSLRDSKRYGKKLFIPGSSPAALPFSSKDAETSFHSRKHAVVSADVTMNDPAGAWTLIGLTDCGKWYPMPLRLIAGGSTIVLIVLLGQLYTLRARYYYQRELDILQRLQVEEVLEIKNQRLTKMNADLVLATRLREDVERIMKHDLKSPLMFVIAVPQILAENEHLSEDEQQLLSNLEDAGYSMQNMIESSLDMFKIEQGTYDLTPSEINMVEVLDDVVLVLGALARAKSLDVQLLKGEKPWDEAPIQFWGEPVLCHSMLANLIRNAMEASPEKGRVSISLKKDRGVRCSVHNEGVIPEEIRETFFEKYTTSGKKGGTGLGTYSARLVVEAHCGTIGFTSSEEEGTTVSFWLPEGKDCLPG